MTAFRASRGKGGRPGVGRLWGGLLLLAGLAGSIDPVFAAELAQGAPIQLIPPRPQNQTTPQQGSPQGPANPQPVLTQPAPGFGAAPPAAITAPIPAGPKGIEIDKLGGLDTDGLGALDPEQGGLGFDLWRSTPHALVERLIPALPAALPSPTLRDLARRLLLSTANPPEGPRSDGPSLLSLRVQKLAEMGDLAGLKALSGAIPASVDDETLTRLRVETRLVDGAADAVCPEVAGILRRYPNAYWQKLQIFCQALDRKGQPVEVGLSLLREEGEDKDQAFFTLIDALMGAKGVKVTSLDDATPLHLAMMRAAEQTLPEDVLRSPLPVILRAVAMSPNASPDLRLAAAERATLVGALSGASLAKIYDGVPVSEDELENALGKAQANYGPQARVLLYRAAKTQSMPLARAEALRAALSLAHAAGDFELAVAVNLPLIEQMTPSPELRFFAPEAARALFYAGKLDQAQGWLAMARQEGATNVRSAEVSVELWPYTRLAGAAPGAWDNNRFLAWYAIQKAKKDAEAKLVDQQAARLLSLLSALGVPVAETAWQPLLGATDGEPAAMPSVAVWQALKDAAASGRRGETLLLALLSIGSTGPAGANPVALEGVVDALRKVGLESEARRLAIEAAVAAGV